MLATNRPGHIALVPYDTLRPAEAVYVSGVNAAHRPQTLRALAAGRHVLCEKPLALTVAEADEMIAAVGRAGCVLAVNHHLRHNAVHRAIRRIVAENQLGTIRAASIVNAGWLPEALRTWRLSGPGAGIALDKTVHDIDLLRYLLADDPVAITATATPCRCRR